MSQECRKPFDLCVTTERNHRELSLEIAEAIQQVLISLNPVTRSLTIQKVSNSIRIRWWSTILVKDIVSTWRWEARNCLIDQHVSIVFTINVLIFEKIWATTFSFPIEHHTITLGISINDWLPSVGRSVPQILTFYLLSEPFKRKMYSSEKTIFERYSVCPSGWFWQCWENWGRLIWSLFWRPWKFCSLYEYMNKHFRKMRCMVAVKMSKAEALSLLLSWGCSWNIYRTCYSVFSLVRGLPLPPLEKNLRFPWIECAIVW